jgi:hypothetical protein
MNFGYLIIVSAHQDIDYLKCAYAAALSIKNTQKEGYDKVALVIDDKSHLEKIKSPWVFDHVIQWDEQTFWNGRSWMDQLSPFEHTVCIDADMIFLRDYSHWVDYFIENCELYVCNKSFTYRGEIVTDDFYRKTFTANELPNLYSFYTFFKKDSELSRDFFELGRYIISNPLEFKNIFLDKFKPKIVGTDEAFALAAKILDITSDVSYDLDFPKVVHLKPMVQNWPWSADRVTEHAGFYLKPNGELKIGNYNQTDLVHYVEKDLVTDEVISLLEEIAWNKN